MCLATIHLVLALAATEDLHLRSVDISHAFINSDIDTEIYMTQPEGFRQGGQEIVCRVNKSLYGLKQAGHLWSKQLQDALEKMGFRRIHSDPSVYIYDQDGIKVIVPIFVDDITFAGASEKDLDDFVAKLATHFKLRDLKPTSFLLGIEITRNRKR